MNAYAITGVFLAAGALGYLLGWKAGREKGYKAGYTLASMVHLRRNLR